MSLLILATDDIVKVEVWDVVDKGKSRHEPFFLMFFSLREALLAATPRTGPLCWRVSWRLRHAGLCVPITLAVDAACATRRAARRSGAGLSELWAWEPLPPASAVAGAGRSVASRQDRSRCRSEVCSTHGGSTRQRSVDRAQLGAAAPPPTPGGRVPLRQLRSGCGVSAPAGKPACSWR